MNKKSILVNGREVSLEDLKSGNISPLSEFEKDLFLFTKEWLNQKDEFIFHSSGSTGTPKNFVFKREQLISSIETTAAALDLHEDDRALLCIPVANTGGKMMAARALHLNMALEAVDPSRNPLDKVSILPDFTAMVPLQLYEILDSKEGTSKLNRIKSTLVGGAPILKDHLEKLQNVKSKVFATYGMTETLSHIALKLLTTNERDNYFKVLPAYKISTDDRMCLQVSGPVTNFSWIQTNDIVDIISRSEFIWRGRADRVINSGGYKIHPEELEDKIQQALLSTGIDRNFFIYDEKDEDLGQKCILLIEGSELKDPTLKELITRFESTLKPYERPKNISFLPEFKINPGGKIDRLGSIEALKQ